MPHGSIKLTIKKSYSIKTLKSLIQKNSKDRCIVNKILINGNQRNDNNTLYDITKSTLVYAVTEIIKSVTVTINNQFINTYENEINLLVNNNETINEIKFKLWNILLTIVPSKLKFCYNVNSSGDNYFSGQ